MLTPRPTAAFRRDVRRCQKRGLPIEALRSVVGRLAAEEALDARHRDHALSGVYAGYRECHIRPDWLLIYRVERGDLILALTRTGTHADLFDE